MSDWIITDTSGGNPKWAVRLADCDRAHADSVLEQLRADPSVPDALTIRRTKSAQRTSTKSVPSQSFLRRLIGG